MTRRISYSPAETFPGVQVSALELLQEDLADWLVSGRERRDILVDVQEGEGEPVMLWAVSVTSGGELYIYDRSYQGDTPDEPLVFAPFAEMNLPELVQVGEAPDGQGVLWDVLVKAREDYFRREHNR